ncbi:MAG: hypothetical protein P8M36_08690 [Gammaproteobacteria bacterium]|nr:hypothetical protein [Gammaproteobacteria bacterium]
MNKYDYINSIEAEDFLNSWKEKILEIGIAYQEGHDYRGKAKAFIETHYAFGSGDVLFKPTVTSDVIFRNNFEDALSYFISGDISEDSGFAIKPREDNKLLEVNYTLEDNLCAVMGILNLRPFNSENKTNIAFTFILVKDNHELKIKVHHSSEIKQ